MYTEIKKGATTYEVDNPRLAKALQAAQSEQEAEKIMKKWRQERWKSN